MMVLFKWSLFLVFISLITLLHIGISQDICSSLIVLEENLLSLLQNFTRTKLQSHFRYYHSSFDSEEAVSWNRDLDASVAMCGDICLFDCNRVVMEAIGGGQSFVVVYELLKTILTSGTISLSSVKRLDSKPILSLVADLQQRAQSPIVQRNQSDIVSQKGYQDARKSPDRRIFIEGGGGGGFGFQVYCDEELVLTAGGGGGGGFNVSTIIGHKGNTGILIEDTLCNHAIGLDSNFGLGGGGGVQLKPKFICDDSEYRDIRICHKLKSKRAARYDPAETDWLDIGGGGGCQSGSLRAFPDGSSTADCLSTLKHGISCQESNDSHVKKFTPAEYIQLLESYSLKLHASCRHVKVSGGGGGGGGTASCCKPLSTGFGFSFQMLSEQTSTVSNQETTVTKPDDHFFKGNISEPNYVYGFRRFSELSSQDSKLNCRLPLYSLFRKEANEYLRQFCPQGFKNWTCISEINRKVFVECTLFSLNTKGLLFPDKYSWWSNTFHGVGAKAISLNNLVAGNQSRGIGINYIANFIYGKGRISSSATVNQLRNKSFVCSSTNNRIESDDYFRDCATIADFFHLRLTEGNVSDRSVSESSFPFLSVPAATLLLEHWVILVFMCVLCTQALLWISLSILRRGSCKRSGYQTLPNDV